jgi:uncharacterized membrane protein YhaH (DUF805 family)
MALLSIKLISFIGNFWDATRTPAQPLRLAAATEAALANLLRIPFVPMMNPPAWRGQTGRLDVSSPYTPYPQGGDQGGYEPGTPQGYLQGGPAGFGEAISQAFGNLLTFSGRASRSAYWWFALFLFIMAVVLDVIGAASGAKAIQYVVDLVVFVLSLALQVRRLHDTNRTGFWWLLAIIPIVGSIVLLVFNCLPGTRGPNKFG